MNELLDALLFPKECQDRGLDPGPFRKHRFYKPYLQKIFRAKCVYCRIPDGFKGDDGFGVDHYLPKKKFPHLRVAWSNLFYACNVCNRWKGTSVSTAERFLPNPCEHRMADHLQYRGAYIESYTPHGAWLVELLQLTDEKRRKLREDMLYALGRFLKDRNDLLRDLTTVEAKHEEGQYSGWVGFQTEISELSEDLEKVESLIERLTGERVRRVPVA